MIATSGGLAGPQAGLELSSLTVEAACIKQLPVHNQVGWPALQAAELKDGAEGGLSALGLLHAPSLLELLVEIQRVGLTEVTRISSLTKLCLFSRRLAPDAGSGDDSDSGSDSGSGSEDEGAEAQAGGVSYLDVSCLGSMEQLQQLDFDLSRKTRCSGMQVLAQGCTSLRILSMSTFVVAVNGSEHGEGPAEEEGPAGQLQGQQGQAQQSLQQEHGQQQGKEEAPWWPALQSVRINKWGSWVSLVALQLHRARRLQRLTLDCNSLDHREELAEGRGVENFREMCRQLAACPEPARPREIVLAMSWPAPQAPVLSCMAPLAGSLTKLALLDSGSGKAYDMGPQDAEALAAEPARA